MVVAASYACLNCSNFIKKRIYANWVCITQKFIDLRISVGPSLYCFLCSAKKTHRYNTIESSAMKHRHLPLLHHAVFNNPPKWNLQYVICSVYRTHSLFFFFKKTFLFQFILLLLWRVVFYFISLTRIYCFKSSYFMDTISQLTKSMCWIFY